MDFSKYAVDNIWTVNPSDAMRYNEGGYDFDLANPITRQLQEDFYRADHDLSKMIEIYGPNDNSPEAIRDHKFVDDAYQALHKQHELGFALDTARDAAGTGPDYYSALNTLLDNDVVIQAARNPRPGRERMAGRAIAAALGLGTGAAAVAGYNALNQGEQY